MISISISDRDINKINRDVEKLTKAGFSKETATALNKVNTSVYSASVKHIRERTQFKRADVVKRYSKPGTVNKNNLRLTYNASEAKPRNLAYGVTPAQRNPFHFRKRKKSGAFKHKGVIAKAWGKRQTYDGTFIVKGRGNNMVVVRRKGSKLVGVHGQSIRRVFATKQHKRVVINRFNERFPVEMDRAVQRAIKKKLGK